MSVQAISSKKKGRRRRRHAPVVSASLPPGSSPGTLMPAPEQLSTHISVMGYGPVGYAESVITNVDEITPILAAWPNAWVKVTGLKDVSTIEALGNYFGLHRLVLEDVVNVTNRSKVEEYENYLFLSVKQGKLSDQFDTEHFSMVLREKLVITFQEKPEDCFTLIKDRIRGGLGKIRQYSTDYLACAILDAIVDSYYPILETINQKLETLETDVVHERGQDTISRIHNLKMDLLYMHRAIYPMRDIINVLAHDDYDYVNTAVLHYFRDCHDQCIQITELTEFYRDVASGLMNTYLAFSGHKMNEVMKILTIISVIFMPLTFIVGVYGMNFDTSKPLNMPELHWPHGYLMVWFIMITITLFMLGWFRKKGWIWHSHHRDD
jgi:magnesium transporter